VDKLPTQLKWSEFVAALRYLKYKPLKSKRGAARHFERLADGEVVTFHEPHGGDTLRQGTLSSYIRNLGITREEFEVALSGGVASGKYVPDDERFRRSTDSDGTIVSNCAMCFELVKKSKIEEEVTAAEAAHPCWLVPSESPAV
jgi:hypothetical protein